jgi:hypothetical protein
MTSIEWLIEQLKSIPLAKDKDEFTKKYYKRTFTYMV